MWRPHPHISSGIAACGNVLRSGTGGRRARNRGMAGASSDRWQGRRQDARCAAVFGIATIVFGSSTSFALSLGALVITCAADVISVVVRQTLVQLRTPDARRGRVGAVNALFIGTSNQLGEFESGVTAAWFGVVPSVVIGGIGTLVVVAAWLRLFPELANTDHLDTLTMQPAAAGGDAPPGPFRKWTEASVLGRRRCDD